MYWLIGDQLINYSVS